LAGAALLAAVVLAVILLRGIPIGGSDTVKGSGIAASEPRSVSAFQAVDLDGTGDVSVVVGGPQRVVVRGDDNLVGRVRTKVAGGTLAIGMHDPVKSNLRLGADVRVSSLTAVALTGAGTVTAAGVNAPSLKVVLAGKGVIRISGRVRRLDVTLAGAGNVLLEGLQARDVDARIAGAGTIAVTATDTLDASIAGTGTIVYAGNPAHVTRHVQGIGTIAPGRP
jgi:hypothetical protein